MKQCLGGSHSFIKSNPIVPGYIPLMYIGYKYNSRKVLGFIYTEGGEIPDPGFPYLSRLPYNYSYFSISPVVFPHVHVRYLNTFHSIDNHNSIQKSNICIAKQGVTQSGYFRLSITVALVMGITYAIMLFCNFISDLIRDKKCLIREYNNRAVYDCFNNPFPFDFHIPFFNLPPITLDGSYIPNKISHYTPYPLPCCLWKLCYYFCRPLLPPISHCTTL